MAAIGIIAGDGDCAEPVRGKNAAIFLLRKARVINRLAAHRTQSLARLGTDGEQESPTGSQMVGKDLQQRALLLGIQVEKRIPGEDSFIELGEMERAHIHPDELGGWETRAGQGQHRFRRIDPGDLESAAGEIERNGIARSASRVEDRAVGRKVRQKPVDPSLLVKGSAALLLPRGPHPFVDIDGARVDVVEFV